MTQLQEYIDQVPNLSGSEDLLAKTIGDSPVFLPESDVDWDNVKSAYAVALHMHQPLVPDPDAELTKAEIISYLQHMMNHPDVGDNHNAPVFRSCYKRMGDFIPELLDGGASPRIMLDYSGTLLHGMRKMGLDDVFDNLKRITCDRRYRRCVEWLGSAWGHPVAPSTPVQDYRLHVSAWQHFFASIFGLEALARIRGFSPAEMALPNHPDVFYHFIKTLKDCGYRWVIVQEHTVEHVEDGSGVKYPHRPHRLVAKSSTGEKICIIAVIKTQGSDTKLIGQMQPCYEARSLQKIELAGKSVPPLVVQISDGENGGVMMNEFPEKYKSVMCESSHSATPAVNVSEYLEYIESLGITEDDLPAIQPIFQSRIWQKLSDDAGPEALEKVIKQLEQQDDRFHMEGGSWTNNISWVQGYDDVLEPMERASALFNKKVLEAGIDPSDARFRNALYHLLITQTSCYRYWGQGQWADYARELCRRVVDIVENNF